jgi:hypothetical protein
MFKCIHAFIVFLFMINMRMRWTPIRWWLVVEMTSISFDALFYVLKNKQMIFFMDGSVKCLVTQQGSEPEYVK